MIASGPVQDRARGCLMGQLVGDALGSIVEFQSAAAIRAAYPNGLREIIPSPVHHTLAGQPTDDSELALALARSLVERRGYDREDVAGAYADWYESDPFDVGATIGQALRAAAAARAAGTSVADAACAAASRQSQGNGALMRQSPLAIWGWRRDPQDLDRFVRADTMLTHPHPVCQAGSAVYVGVLSLIVREGTGGREAYRRARDWHQHYSGRSVEVPAAIDEAETVLPVFSRNQGHVLIALQNAFYQALHAPSFEEGLVQTVMAGGDTDTNAAIAGAMLGALYGVEAIPRQWRDAVLSCRPRLGSPGVLQPRPSRYWPVDALDLADSLLEAGIEQAGQAGT